MVAPVPRSFCVWYGTWAFGDELGVRWNLASCGIMATGITWRITSQAVFESRASFHTGIPKLGPIPIACSELDFHGSCPAGMVRSIRWPPKARQPSPSPSSAAYIDDRVQLPWSAAGGLGFTHSPGCVQPGRLRLAGRRRWTVS
eukprot:359619-Chlamydomonas_euryale.AAC.4